MKNFISKLTKLTAASILMMSFVSCGGKEDRKASYLEKGKTYLEEKNYDKARIEFKNVLQIDPKFADAYFYMGKLEEKNKEYIKAIGMFKKAIELNPIYDDAKIDLAKIYTVAGIADLISKAKILLNEVAKNQPDNTKVKLILAMIEYKTGDKKKSLAEIEALVAKDPSLSEGVMILSAIYKVDNKVKQAIDILTLGIANNPVDIPMRIELAKLLVAKKDYINAEKYFLESISIDPNEYKLKVAISAFYAHSGQLDKALSILRKAMEEDDENAARHIVLIKFLASQVSSLAAEEELENAITKKPELYDLKFYQVLFYGMLNKREEAEAVLKQIIADKDQENEGVKAKVLLANMYLNNHERIKAKKYVDEVIKEFPNNNDALAIAGKIALLDLDATSAINKLRTVVKNNPKNAEAAYLLAQAYELNNESLLAENQLKNAIEANPVNDVVHINYANYLYSKGRIDDVVKLLDRANTYFDSSYGLLELKLKVAVAQKSESEFLKVLDSMENLDKTNAATYVTRGKYFMSKGDFNAAIKQFEISYEKSSDKYEPLKLITAAHLKNKQPNMAIQRLQEIINEAPENPIAYLLIGQVYLEQNNVNKARQELLRAIKVRSDWLPPYMTLAGSYMSEKNTEEALAVYHKALKDVKNTTRVYMNIAAIYESLKNYTSAMQSYQKIIDVNPNDTLALNNYASLLLDFGDDAGFPKALSYAQKFEKLKKPALQDTLGWAYAKTGDYTKAIELLKPIVDKAPNISIFRYHLAYALFQSGDKTAAKSHLEVAVSSKQEFIGKKHARELLASL